MATTAGKPDVHVGLKALNVDPANVELAAAALERDAGCEPARALLLAGALAGAAAEEALRLVAGTAQVYGSVVDERVARLERLIGALPDDEPVPTDFEVAAAFRITMQQARTVLQTFEARFSEAYQEHMAKLLKDFETTAEERKGSVVYVFQFKDPTALEHAVAELWRHGLARSVTPDRTMLSLTVETTVRDRHGRDASEVLSGKPIPRR